MKPQTPEQLCQQWMDKIFYRYANSLGGINVLLNKEIGAFNGQAGLLIQIVDAMEELEVAYSIIPQHRGVGYTGEAT